jgi:hypothetical protein
MITVVGYGSLLSEESARKTAPGLSGFRLVSVTGYKRIFNKVGIIFLQTGIADINTPYLSSCATRSAPEVTIVCSAFECSEAEFLNIYEREHRFRWIEVALSSAVSQDAGRICTEYNDTDYRLNKCVTDKVYFERVGRYYTGKIWRNDILPNKRYLALCLKAAATHGTQVLDNFLDTSFLADGTTPLRRYLAEHPDAVVPNDGDYHTQLSPGASA